MKPARLPLRGQLLYDLTSSKPFPSARFPSLLKAFLPFGSKTSSASPAKSLFLLSLKNLQFPRFKPFQSLNPHFPSASLFSAPAPEHKGGVRALDKGSQKS
jgi:hypothetical protein